MYWVYLISCIALVSADKLNNRYLPPPPDAKQAGGNEGDLLPPLEPPYIDPYSDPSLGDLENIQNTRNLPKDGYDNSLSSGTSRGEYGRSYSRKPSRPVPGLDTVNNVQYNPYPETRSRKQLIENEHQIKNVKDSSFQNTGGKFISGSYSYKGPDNVLVTVTYTADDEEKNERAGRTLPSRGQGRQLKNDELEAGVVPTPPTLQGALNRAFDFHSQKQQPIESDRGNQGYEYEAPKDEARSSSQGYSYPKPQ